MTSKTNCARCDEPCDFGQRGDGPAVQSSETLESFCSLDCLALDCLLKWIEWSLSTALKSHPFSPDASWRNKTKTTVESLVAAERYNEAQDYLKFL